MRESNWATAGSEGWRGSPRAPRVFHDASDGYGVEAEDFGSDWDGIEIVGLIERDGFIGTETLDGDWE